MSYVVAYYRPRKYKAALTQAGGFESQACGCREDTCLQCKERSLSWASETFPVNSHTLNLESASSSDSGEWGKEGKPEKRSQDPQALKINLTAEARAGSLAEAQGQQQGPLVSQGIHVLLFENILNSLQYAKI